MVFRPASEVRADTVKPPPVVEQQYLEEHAAFVHLLECSAREGMFTTYITLLPITTDQYRRTEWHRMRFIHEGFRVLYREREGDLEVSWSHRIDADVESQRLRKIAEAKKAEIVERDNRWLSTRVSEEIEGAQIAGIPRCVVKTSLKYAVDTVVNELRTAGYAVSKTEERGGRTITLEISWDKAGWKWYAEKCSDECREVCDGEG